VPLQPARGLRRVVAPVVRRPLCQRDRRIRRHGEYRFPPGTVAAIQPSTPVGKLAGDLHVIGARRRHTLQHDHRVPMVARSVRARQILALDDHADEVQPDRRVDCSHHRPQLRRPLKAHPHPHPPRSGVMPDPDRCSQCGRIRAARQISSAHFARGSHGPGDHRSCAHRVGPIGQCPPDLGRLQRGPRFRRRRLRRIVNHAPCHLRPTGLMYLSLQIEVLTLPRQFLVADVQQLPLPAHRIRQDPHPARGRVQPLRPISRPGSRGRPHLGLRHPAMRRRHGSVCPGAHRRPPDERILDRVHFCPQHVDLARHLSVLPD